MCIRDSRRAAQADPVIGCVGQRCRKAAIARNRHRLAIDARFYRLDIDRAPDDRDRSLDAADRRGRFGGCGERCCERHARGERGGGAKCPQKRIGRAITNPYFCLLYTSRCV